MEKLSEKLTVNLLKKLKSGLDLLAQYDAGEYRPDSNCLVRSDPYNFCDATSADEHTVFLSAKEVMLLHNQISNAPVLSLEMLESAVARPGQVASYEELSVCEAGMLLAESIIADHPFADGNKRTALLSLCAFLIINEISFPDNPKSLADIIIAMAEKKLDARQAARFVKY